MQINKNVYSLLLIIIIYQIRRQQSDSRCSTLAARSLRRTTHLTWRTRSQNPFCNQRLTMVPLRRTCRKCSSTVLNWLSTSRPTAPPARPSSSAFPSDPSPVSARSLTRSLPTSKASSTGPSSSLPTAPSSPSMTQNSEETQKQNPDRCPRCSSRRYLLPRLDRRQDHPRYPRRKETHQDLLRPPRQGKGREQARCHQPHLPQAHHPQDHPPLRSPQLLPKEGPRGQEAVSKVWLLLNELATSSLAQ
ncbi:hypothetical protein FGO68_gene14076 [Halteria grandinella]|uniref:Uncharacterized protein n=1 Tax=Halteria grandinella TaxID=5974 RepID=A0A8J8P499_HALGN|nr:hypothetical protein FGO68_gene14076 [Halteria grandinella]